MGRRGPHHDGRRLSRRAPRAPRPPIASRIEAPTAPRAVSFECKARAVSALSCGIFRDGPRADATAAEDGSFDVEFQIRPRFRWLPGPARDCHVSRCGIGAYDGDGPLDVADEPLSAITPITFAPRA